jgi:hypothetical protein
VRVELRDHPLDRPLQKPRPVDRVYVLVFDEYEHARKLPDEVIRALGGGREPRPKRKSKGDYEERESTYIKKPARAEGGAT